MGSSLAITKAALLLVASISHYIGLRPPQPSTPENAYRGQHFETMVMIWAFLSQVTIGALSASNALVIVASLMQPGRVQAQIMEALCPYPSPSVQSLAHIDPIFSLGIITMALACGLRVWCYTTLGRMFTYRVGVVPEHKLVTSGPYAFVRHPSYTGVFLMLVGASTTFLFSPHNYIRECGVDLTPWKWWTIYWCSCACFSIFSLINRGRVEDELMKKIFGQGWYAYSARVPYKFIPFVY